MGLWILAAGGTGALVVLGYFAFVTLRMAREADADEREDGYADASSGWSLSIPLPMLFALIALGLVVAGLLIRAGQAYEIPFKPILPAAGTSTPQPHRQQLGPAGTPYLP